MPARVITVANQKGGVGKTTTAVSLGTALTGTKSSVEKVAGRRVLLIDLDPQANATSSLGLVDPARERSTYDVLLGEASLADIIIPTDVPGLDLAPADRALSGAQVEMVSMPDREHCLVRALDALNVSHPSRAFSKPNYIPPAPLSRTRERGSRRVTDCGLLSPFAH
jgi:chromosome partitioning protein